MIPVAKEQIWQIISENNISNVADVYSMQQSQRCIPGNKTTIG